MSQKTTERLGNIGDCVDASQEEVPCVAEEVEDTDTARSTAESRVEITDEV